MEEFSNAYASTIQLFIAIGTVSLSIISFFSIWQAKVILNVTLFEYNNNLWLSVHNIGSVNTYIDANNFLFVKIFFKQRERLLPGIPHGSTHQVVIPEGSEDLPCNMTLENLIDRLDLGTKCYLNRIRKKFNVMYFLYLYTSNGKKFRVKFNKDLLKKLKNIDIQ